MKKSAKKQSKAERRRAAMQRRLAGIRVSVPDPAAAEPTLAPPGVTAGVFDGQGAPQPWRPAWLAEFANSGNVRRACEAAKVHRKDVWLAEQVDLDFREAKARAFQDFVDRLRGVAVERAAALSDRLLEFLLRSHEPETYAPERRFRVVGGVPVPLGEAPAALPASASGAQVAVPEGVDVREDRVILQIANGQVLLEGTARPTNGGKP